ncbi:MAG: hypothetical protein JXR13_06225 [Thalassovita sp.]
MSRRVSSLKGDQLGRLFELIRQQNLHNKRRRRQEQPLCTSSASIMVRDASNSLRPDLPLGQ